MNEDVSDNEDGFSFSDNDSTPQECNLPTKEVTRNENQEENYNKEGEEVESTISCQDSSISSNKAESLITINGRRITVKRQRGSLSRVSLKDSVPTSGSEIQFMSARAYISPFNQNLETPNTDFFGTYLDSLAVTNDVSPSLKQDPQPPTILAKKASLRSLESSRSEAFSNILCANINGKHSLDIISPTFDDPNGAKNEELISQLLEPLTLSELIELPNINDDLIRPVSNNSKEDIGAPPPSAFTLKSGDIATHWGKFIDRHLNVTDDHLFLVENPEKTSIYEAEQDENSLLNGKPTDNSAEVEISGKFQNSRLLLSLESKKKLEMLNDDDNLSFDGLDFAICAKCGRQKAYYYCEKCSKKHYYHHHHYHGEKNHLKTRDHRESKLRRLRDRTERKHKIKRRERGAKKKKNKKRRREKIASAVKILTSTSAIEDKEPEIEKNDNNEKMKAEKLSMKEKIVEINAEKLKLAIDGNVELESRIEVDHPTSLKPKNKSEISKKVSFEDCVRDPCSEENVSDKEENESLTNSIVNSSKYLDTDKFFDALESSKKALTGTLSASYKSMSAFLAGNTEIDSPSKEKKIDPEIDNNNKGEIQKNESPETAYESKFIQQSIKPFPFVKEASVVQENNLISRPPLIETTISNNIESKISSEKKSWKDKFIGRAKLQRKKIVR